MDKTLILFLSSSPKGATEQEEDTPFIKAYRGIRNKIESAEYREYFDLEQEHQISVKELMDLLPKKNPQIVHFFGHGEKSFLLLEDENGDIEEANLTSFTDLLEALNGRKEIASEKKIRCVVLVACKSKRIAEAISKHVDCAIGMTSAIGVQAGMDFAETFYSRLCGGDSVQFSFEYACIRLGFKNSADANRPILVPRQGIDPSKIYFVPIDSDTYLGLSGLWYGVHLSKDSEGQRAVSRHIYNLKVDRKGVIEGIVDEVSAKPRYKYIVNGTVRHGGMFLSGEIKSNTPTYAWLFNVLYDRNVIPGFIFSKDFEDKPFASYIILSRTRISDERYFANLKEAKKRFYLR